MLYYEYTNSEFYIYKYINCHQGLFKKYLMLRVGGYAIVLWKTVTKIYKGGEV